MNVFHCLCAFLPMTFVNAIPDIKLSDCIYIYIYLSSKIKIFIFFIFNQQSECTFYELML
jgi:hypothetical protein